ncbi:MAG: RNA-guided endonuclease TnpB family protein [Lutibacter sp.]|jgi:putative transposase
MRKTYKYRIYAREQTITKAENWLGLCCDLYNACLDQRISVYRSKRENTSGFDQANELRDIKDKIPEYKLINSQVLQGVTERLHKAYQNFFRRVQKGGEKPGFPRFKSKSRYDSFTLKNTSWKLEGRYLWIKNVGRFKMKLSRPIQGVIKTIMIQRTSTGKWYASFSCDNVSEKRLDPNDKTIGLDMGIKSYLTDSEGNHVENPKWLKQNQKDLRVKQRKLSRRKKGSKRRVKARILVAKAHEKVRNQRLDFQHKLANEYIKKYGKIVIEDLAIQNMVKNHKLAKSISDCAWGQFFQLLKYKAEEAGREIIENYRFSPTSKACNACGEINNNLKLSDRQWVCLKCGALHDRDLNAAKNILKSGLGQSLQVLTWSSA